MKKSFFMLILILFIFLYSSTVFAVGIGAFLDVSGGSGEAEWESDYDSWDIDSNTVAGGFVLDTSPTNQSVFNYRLNVGIASQEIEPRNDVPLESTGIYVENIFGFAFSKNENFR